MPNDELLIYETNAQRFSVKACFTQIHNMPSWSTKTNYTSGSTVNLKNVAKFV